MCCRATNAARRSLPPCGRRVDALWRADANVEESLKAVLRGHPAASLRGSGSDGEADFKA